MDLSSLEICQRGIGNLPNVSTVADLQTTSLAQEQLCDSPWSMFHRKLQGMTTETLLGPRAISLTHPVSKQAKPKQLFPGPNPQPVLYSPFYNAFDATSHFYLLGLSSSSTALMNMIINWFSSYLSHCFFSASFFFFPNQFFSATPTQFFSWLPPPLAYSTFQSLMTFNNHLYELRAFVPESWITWSSSSSSNHMAIWRASTKAMKSHTHLQAGPLLRSIGHIFADRTAEKSIFYGYTQIRYLLFILTQALQFLADTVNYFWVAQEFY